MTVKLLTIGEFARASRLSPKALRLYDDLGLLRPFRVDQWSGYRYYAPSQLERARLVAWLRRLGMPLAQIAAVVQAPPAGAAGLVATFLRTAEAELAERQRLAQFLIGYLSERATAMHETLTIRYAAASDIGLVRERNQDTGYADPRLIAVADGFGPAGEAASTAVIDALRGLESAPPGTLRPAGEVAGSGESADAGPADLLNLLSDAVSAAGASIRAIAESDPDLAGSGATLTAMLLSGSRLALVHIGDTRAYLFRDGGLFQVTHDHSVTQSLVDEGRLTPEEALSHPQRSLLIRAVGASSEEMAESGLREEQARMAATPDLSLLEARAGDRYLLTSDGLTNVVPDSVIRQTLSDQDRSPTDVVRHLIALANEAGGPDNIALALADVTNAGAPAT
ncbi:MAG TPA: MerR family transcriptional regulator [Trebonia sp.]